MINQLSNIIAKLRGMGLAIDQIDEIVSDLTPFMYRPAAAAYTQLNGRNSIVIPNGFGFTVRTTAEFTEFWPDTTWIDTHFTSDLAPLLGTKTTWKERGYAVPDDAKPVTHVRRNPLGYKKTRFETPVYYLGQLREVRGARARARREAYQTALRIVSELKLPEYEMGTVAR